MIFNRIYNRLAINALTVSDYQRAEKYFYKILKSSPERPGANYNYAISLIGLKNFNQAAEHLKKEIDVSGEHYNILKALSELEYNSGNRKDAVSWLKKAIERCPLANEEKIMKQKLKPAKSEELYARYVESHGFFEKGNELLDSEDWQAAREMFNQALKLDSTNPYIYNNLGFISMMKENKNEEACDLFIKALKIAEIPIIRKNLQKAEFRIKKNSLKIKKGK